MVILNVRGGHKLRYIKMRNLIFLISEAQCNSAIAERHFRTKLKRNLTSGIETSLHNANTSFFSILGKKSK